MKRKKFSEEEGQRLSNKYGWSRQRLDYWRKRGLLPHDPSTEKSVFIIERYTLYYLMEKYDVKISDLIQVMGVTHETIWKWKNGKTKPRLRYFRLLQSYFMGVIEKAEEKKK